MKKIILSVLAAIGLGTMAYAVPAMPGLRTFTQPDGSTVTVRLLGDERAHFYVSEDNYPLLEDSEGRLCYAEIGLDGLVRASGVQARNSARRVQAEKDIMARADAADLSQRLMTQILANSPARVPQTGMGLNDTTFPSKGEVRALVILVDYADVKFNTPNAQDYFTRLMNEEGFSDNGGTGSARDFYIESSNGQFRPIFDVVGPVELPNNRSYYGSNNSYGSDAHPADMVIHACQLLDDEVDFSLYDANDDGLIDNIYVFYAGAGEASGGPSDSVWPHSWDVFSAGGQTYRFDGKILNHYACSNEWMPWYTPACPDGIGTFCHEFGHVLGLPDLYDTRNAASGYGPGSWSIMGHGSYNNESRTPPTFSSYERNALSWMELHPLTKAASIELDPLLESNFAAVISVPGKDSEFFLFENRQQRGWDTYLPSHGMLVWHIDYAPDVFNSNIVNVDGSHQYVDLVEAGGVSARDAAIPFPGSYGITSFDAVGWGGVEIGLPITNIAETNGIIGFDVLGGITSLGDPTSIKALPEATTPYSLTLQWDAVPDANQYLLTVWSGDADYVKGYVGKSVRGTTHVVEGLSPETEYHFSLKAKAGNVESAKAVSGSATTSDVTFAFMKVNTLPAENISDNGFTARWEPIEGASDYEVSFSALAPGRSNKIVADQGIKTPNGWSTDAVRNFTIASYAGKAVPSLRMDINESYLRTEVFTDEITKLEFWYRGNSNGESNSIEVQFRADADSEWATAYTVCPIAASGTNVTVDAPMGNHQARIVFRRNDSGVLALDDVTVSTQALVVKPIEGCQNLSAGGKTSYDFEVTPEMGVRKELYYTVVGVNAQGNKTMVSDSRYVKLGSSSVENVIEAADDAIRVRGLQIIYCGEAGAVMNVFDTTGRLVGSATADGDGTAVFTAPAPGFYVAVAAGKSAKALCR